MRLFCFVSTMFCKVQAESLSILPNKFFQIFKLHLFLLTILVSIILANPDVSGFLVKALTDPATLTQFGVICQALRYINSNLL